MESLPNKPRIFHRFVYVAHPLHKHCSTDGGRSAEMLTTLTLEITSVSENATENATAKAAEKAAAALSIPEGSCRLGVETSIDLLIPDR